MSELTDNQKKLLRMAVKKFALEECTGCKYASSGPLDCPYFDPAHLNLWECLNWEEDSCCN